MKFDPSLTVLESALAAILGVLEWLIGIPVSIFQGYSSLLGWSVDAANSLFDSYGYWVVFFGTLFENTLFLGVLIPGALVVVLAGLSSQDGTISFPLAFILAVAGTIIGDTISYFLGRFGWSRIARLREPVERIREPLMRRGALFVLVYHFAGYTRIVGPTAAGLFRMPLRAWAIADYTGAVIWVGAFMGVGYGLGLAGLTLNSTDRYFRYFEWGLLVIVLIWFYYLYGMAMRMWETQQASNHGGEADPVEAATD